MQLDPDSLQSEDSKQQQVKVEINLSGSHRVVDKESSGKEFLPDIPLTHSLAPEHSEFNLLSRHGD